MSEGQANPVAVVTGGARRLGRHLCSSLARRGYDVVILYRESSTDARSLEQDIRVTGRRARSLAVDIGVEPYLVSSSVIGVVAQRLIRMVCPSCKQEIEPES